MGRTPDPLRNQKTSQDLTHLTFNSSNHLQERKIYRKICISPAFIIEQYSISTAYNVNTLYIVCLVEGPAEKSSLILSATRNQNTCLLCSSNSETLFFYQHLPAGKDTSRLVFWQLVSDQAKLEFSKEQVETCKGFDIQTQKESEKTCL